MMAYYFDLGLYTFSILFYYLFFENCYSNDKKSSFVLEFKLLFDYISEIH
jgi:hypothetical protein